MFLFKNKGAKSKSDPVYDTVSKSTESKKSLDAGDQREPMDNIQRQQLLQQQQQQQQRSHLQQQQQQQRMCNSLARHQQQQFQQQLQMSPVMRRDDVQTPRQCGQAAMSSSDQLYQQDQLELDVAKTSDDNIRNPVGMQQQRQQHYEMVDNRSPASEHTSTTCRNRTCRLPGGGGSGGGSGTWSPAGSLRRPGRGGSCSNRSQTLLHAYSRSVERSLGQIFLVFRGETKRVTLPSHLTSINDVWSLFIRAFPDRITVDSFLPSSSVRPDVTAPDHCSPRVVEGGKPPPPPCGPLFIVYVLDQAASVFYQLDDLRDIHDMAVLKIYECNSVSSATAPSMNSSSPAFFPDSVCLNVDPSSVVAGNGSPTAWVMRDPAHRYPPLSPLAGAGAQLMIQSSPRHIGRIISAQSTPTNPEFPCDADQWTYGSYEALPCRTWSMSMHGAGRRDPSYGNKRYTSDMAFSYGQLATSGLRSPAVQRHSTSYLPEVDMHGGPSSGVYSSPYSPQSMNGVNPHHLDSYQENSMCPSPAQSAASSIAVDYETRQRMQEMEDRLLSLQTWIEQSTSAARMGQQMWLEQGNSIQPETVLRPYSVCSNSSGGEKSYHGQHGCDKIEHGSGSTETVTQPRGVLDTSALASIRRQAEQLRSDWTDLKRLQLTQSADLNYALRTTADTVAAKVNKLLARSDNGSNVLSNESNESDIKRNGSSAIPSQDSLTNGRYLPSAWPLKQTPAFSTDPKSAARRLFGPSVPAVVDGSFRTQPTESQPSPATSTTTTTTSTLTNRRHSASLTSHTLLNNFFSRPTSASHSAKPSTVNDEMKTAKDITAIIPTDNVGSSETSNGRQGGSNQTVGEVITNGVAGSVKRLPPAPPPRQVSSLPSPADQSNQTVWLRQSQEQSDESEPQQIDLLLQSQQLKNVQSDNQQSEPLFLDETNDVSTPYCNSNNKPSCAQQKTTSSFNEEDVAGFKAQHSNDNRRVQPEGQDRRLAAHMAALGDSSMQYRGSGSRQFPTFSTAGRKSPDSSDSDSSSSIESQLGMETNRRGRPPPVPPPPTHLR